DWKLNSASWFSRIETCWYSSLTVTNLRRPELACLGRIQHLGQASEFCPAALAACAGQFCRIDAPPSGIVHPADLPVFEQLPNSGSPWSCTSQHFLRDFLSQKLGFAPVRRNRSRGSALCPSSHVQPVFDFSFFVGEYAVGGSHSTASAGLVSNTGDGELHGNLAERSIGGTELHRSE